MLFLSVCTLNLLELWNLNCTVVLLLLLHIQCPCSREKSGRVNAIVRPSYRGSVAMLSTKWITLWKKLEVRRLFVSTTRF